MKSHILKSVLMLAVCTGFFAGCANSDEYPTPSSILTTYELTPTVTVQQVKTVANTSVPVVFTTEHEILEGYVTSNDRESNFYNSISFQTIPTDGSQPVGFSVSVNVKGYEKGFVPGRKVFIDLKDLNAATVDGSLQIGALFNGGIGRISENDWQNHLFPSATVVPENDFVRNVTLSQAATDANLNTLVEIQNVQFVDESLNRTYYDVNSGGGSTNHSIISTTGGTTRYFRVSDFAPFSTHQVPSGSGSIRGVMTKYGSDYQFLVRDENDVHLTGTRVSIHSPVGGADVQFTGAFTEPFTAYNVGQTDFPKYVNDQTVGGRYWALKQYPSGTGNKYIEMTSFGGGGVTAKTYFFVPVDFTAASTFTFKKEIRYSQGEVLKVFYVTSANYTTSGPINVSSFVDITSSFSLVYPATGASDNSFSSAGTYNIPAGLTGNGFFVFQYSGTPSVTTTIQLDDITVN